jgi:hypothetical protein
MLANFDYYGAAALVAALGAVLASVFGFMNGRKAATIQTAAQQISTAVTTSNGSTIGELAENAEARRTGIPEPHDVAPPASP